MMKQALALIHSIIAAVYGFLVGVKSSFSSHSFEKVLSTLINLLYRCKNSEIYDFHIDCHYILITQ